MESNEFIIMRKKLQKTQKELAVLLGISLKAVCSYEQGWRKVPVHVERQLIFLLSRKKTHLMENENCWDIRNCPEEKRTHCPAWEFHSGQFCWFINGTICDDTVHKTWKEKMELCKTCIVMKKIT